MRAVLPILVVLGCSSGAPTLFVDLRTDLVPVVELAEVTVSLEADGATRLETHTVLSSDGFIRGVRVARFDEAPVGDVVVSVQLLAANGERLGIRRTSVSIRGETVATIVFSRSCLDVVCPNGDAAATECLNGRCVEPDCAVDALENCGDVACTSDTDCPEPTVACGERNCTDGACFIRPVEGACGAGEACSPALGCVLVPDGADAGVLDGGVPDASMDDASTDASMGDASLPDAAEPECTMDVQCDDGVFCNGVEVCVEQTCVPGAPVVCDDAVACTDDTCNEDAGACAFAPNDGRCTATAGGRCDADSDCQYPTCTAVTCVAGPCETAMCSGDTCVRTGLCGGGEMCCGGSCAPAGCDDGNPCTDDSCGGGGCVNAPNTNACSDGNLCTIGDQCSLGECDPGMPRNCNDGNLCTDDTCAPATGCLHANNTAACDDDNACTPTDRCAAGACVGSGTMVCDDGNGCTTDSCVAPGGCVFAPVASGTMCAADVCGPWQPCRGSCATGGTQRRVCRPQECTDVGACEDGTSYMESQDCTLNPGDSCTMCGGVGCGGIGSRCVGTCDGSGCCNPDS